MKEPILISLDKAFRLVLLAGVHAYQRYLSWALGGQCRFFPSCSCYAEEALEYGPLLRALRLILWRLMRCQPLCKGGMDPFPHQPGEERYRLKRPE